MKRNYNISNFIVENIKSRELKRKLSNNFNLLKKKILVDINKKQNFFNVFEKKFSLNIKVKDFKKFKKFKTVVVIGMGGSILGAEAIYQFLGEKIKKKFYFFNDLNPEKITKFKKDKDLSKILFIVISKSGNTTETLSNFLFLNILDNFKKNIIIISGKKNSFLYKLSKTKNLFFIEHKNYIGGRYSVLSEAGLVPAYLMGLNISSLRKNLNKYLKAQGNQILKTNSLKLANLILKKKKTNLVLLNYTPKLEKFLNWYQQLIAESLGKKQKGFFPVLSNVPKDHHSLLQLYLDGPKDKLFYIFSVKDFGKHKIKTKRFGSNLGYLNNKNLSEIKEAQKQALKNSFYLNKISFVEFNIKKKDEETLGELFSYFMLETIFIGNLIGVNPFDQNAVEQVKILTKKELSK